MKLKEREINNEYTSILVKQRLSDIRDSIHDEDEPGSDKQDEQIEVCHDKHAFEKK